VKIKVYEYYDGWYSGLSLMTWGTCKDDAAKRFKDYLKKNEPDIEFKKEMVRAGRTVFDCNPYRKEKR
jgi:hypothetical protein